MFKRGGRGGVRGMFGPTPNNGGAFYGVANLSASCIYGLVFISGPPYVCHEVRFEARVKASAGGSAFFTSQPDPSFALAN